MSVEDEKLMCCTSLFQSIPRTHLKCTRLLIDKNGVNQLVEEHSPLWLAAVYTKVDSIRCLLEMKANVNQADSKGKTPLWVACRGRDIDCVRILLDANANVNHRDNEGRTVLMSAVSLIHPIPKIVKLLLKHNSNVSQADNKGRTPFQVALKMKNFKIALILEIRYLLCDDMVHLIWSYIEW